MNEIIINAQESIKNDEVREAAKILAKYNLGIIIPHMHNTETGELITLPPEIISSEKDLKISFVQSNDTEKDALPVAWRWNDNEMSVCSNCCITIDTNDA